MPPASPGQTSRNPTAQPARRPVINWADVTANDVYVRSGDSLNHYTICKLGAGDRVAIVGQRGEWYEILPPEAAFSLISGDYVDTTDDKTGIVNGNNVRVRAGSTLNDNKYTVQTMLSRGARVTILGRNPDGFLRIKPPPGATLWINGAFARPTMGSDASPQAKTSTAGTDAAASPGSTYSSSEPPPPGGVFGSPVSSQTIAPTDTASSSRPNWRTQLEQVDTAAKAELAKPPVVRNFEELIQRYRALSRQDEDGYAQRYAMTRLEQIDNMVALAAAIEKVNALGEAADAKRRDYLAARATIPAVAPPAPSGIEIQGELRISALYPPGSTVKRFRLIDPTTPTGRTISYVELPPDSPIKIDSFIGRFVGVRASRKYLQAGGVDPVPIYVARELILLDPPQAPTDATDADGH